MIIVTAKMVKELREMTLAGMSDCKKALDAAQGNMDKALIILREKGLASAAQKASRAASEGVVSTIMKEGHSVGFAVEVNCETDFVTKNDAFQKFVNNLKTIISNIQPMNREELLMAQYDSQGTRVQDAATALVAQIGENITVRRFERIGTGTNFVTSYVHGAGKIGVLVELAGTDIQKHISHPTLNELGKDVALQIAAMKPQYLSEHDVPHDILKTEEGIIRNKFLQQGKPETILSKIIPSSMKTWFKEICLLDQAFVKDDSKNIAQHVSDWGKKLGMGDLKIHAFIRLELGQGVEKKTENFATEVAEAVFAAQK
jgi:elongation factor Ts